MQYYVCWLVIAAVNIERGSMGHKSHGQEQDLQGQDRGQKTWLRGQLQMFQPDWRSKYVIA